MSVNNVTIEECYTFGSLELAFQISVIKPRMYMLKKSYT